MRLIGRGRLRQRDDYLIRRMSAGIADALNQRIMHSGTIHRLADMVIVWSLVERHPNLSAALEVDAHGNMVPKQNAQHAGDGKDQGEAEKEPLLSQPVDIRCFKQFQAHALTPSAKTYRSRNLSKSK